jgi:hypothetical protein
MPTLTGMKGDGFYNQHSAPQLAAILGVLPWLEKAVEQMELPAVDPIVVVDYGCSEGGNSIVLMKAIVDALRAKTPRPVQTVHSDLPSNNFNQLFANLAGASFRSAASQVYSAAVGGSMFEQLLPSQTVTIAMTFNALGWLDSLPEIDVPDYISPMGPSRPRPGVSAPEHAREAFARQAYEDLVLFYRARGDEIVPGGKLLVATFGRNENHRTCDGIYDLLNDALLELVARGRLPREACQKLVFPTYFRSREELIAPVIESDGQFQHKFRVDRVESLEIPVPFQERLAESGDVLVFGGEYTAFLRAITEPILSASFANLAGLGDLLDDVYRRVRNRLIADPAGYEFHFIEVAALLTRLGG